MSSTVPGMKSSFIFGNACHAGGSQEGVALTIRLFSIRVTS